MNVHSGKRLASIDSALRALPLTRGRRSQCCIRKAQGPCFALKEVLSPPSLLAASTLASEPPTQTWSSSSINIRTAGVSRSSNWPVLAEWMKAQTAPPAMRMASGITRKRTLMRAPRCMGSRRSDFVHRPTVSTSKQASIQGKWGVSARAHSSRLFRWKGHPADLR